MRLEQTDLKLLALDEPSKVSKASSAALIATVCVLFLLAIGLLNAGPSDWPMMPSVVSGQQLAMAVVCGFTALPLLVYAWSSGRRGFLILAGTYLFVGLTNLATPLFTANGMVVTNPPTQLLGSAQSPFYAYTIWNWVFVIGVLVAAVVVDRDRLRGRRPGLSRGEVGVTLAVVAAGFAVAFMVLLWGAELLPPLVRGTTLTRFATVTTLLLILVCIVGGLYLLVVIRRRGSFIIRWLMAVLLAILVESLVVLRPELNLYTFYANLAFGLLAMCVLLIALLWLLGRVGRSQQLLVATDVNTSASSRFTFLARLEAELEQSRRVGRPVALLWVDLDAFKSINDQLGHAVGDAVLREVVSRTRAQVKPGDMVGRVGGDELGVMLCDEGGPVADARVEETADRVLAAIKEPIVVADMIALVTASIGVAVAPRDASEISELLLCSDLAMFSAKDRGGDQIARYTQAMAFQARRDAELRQDLSASLRSAAFDLDYQLIVDTATGRACGAESLVRWLREGRRVTAGEFVGFAERSGQILGIGQQVMSVLERDAGELLAAGGADFFLTMNLSVRELMDASVSRRVLDGPLAQFIPRIVIEVTESIELYEDSEAARSLHELAAAGYPLAIDDFGNGYSNLTLLNQLHPAFMKIDRGLVRNAGAGVEGGLSLLTAAAAAAESLNCTVIAEGVETQSEGEIVESLGCRYSQGYKWARPMPKDELLRYLNRTPSMGEAGQPRSTDIPAMRGVPKSLA